MAVWLVLAWLMVAKGMAHHQCPFACMRVCVGVYAIGMVAYTPTTLGVGSILAGCRGGCWFVACRPRFVGVAVRVPGVAIGGGAACCSLPMVEAVSCQRWPLLIL